MRLNHFKKWVMGQVDAITCVRGGQLNLADSERNVRSVLLELP